MFGREPVAIAGAVRAIILCAVAFGLQWTPEQIGATMLAVEAVLTLITRQSVTPNQTVQQNFVKVPKTIVVLLLACALGSGCVPPPPNLTPDAVRAFHGTQIIKDLDRLMEVAVAAHNTQPPILTVDETRAVVQWHQVAITAVHASAAGWQAGVTAGLDQMLKTLTPRARDTLTPYVAIVRSLIKEMS